MFDNILVLNPEMKLCYFAECEPHRYLLAKDLFVRMVCEYCEKAIRDDLGKESDRGWNQTNNLQLYTPEL